MSLPRQIWRVAAYELRALAGSARAITVLILFLLVGLAASGTFASCQESFDEKKADFEMNVQQSVQHSGQLQLPDNYVYRLALGALVSKGDPDLTEFLVQIPPFFLAYLLGCLFLYPFLLALLGYDQVAADLTTGAAKFPLLRISRTALALGKVTAQILLFLLVSGVNAGLTLAVVMGKLPSLEFGDSLFNLLRFWPAILAQGICYIGLTACWSMLVPSAGGALGAALVSPLIFWGFSLLTPYWDAGGMSAVVGAVGYLFPKAHESGLIGPFSAELVGALTLQVAYGALFFGLGLWAFRRRDLP